MCIFAWRYVHIQAIYIQTAVIAVSFFLTYVTVLRTYSILCGIYGTVCIDCHQFFVVIGIDGDCAAKTVNWCFAPGFLCFLTGCWIRGDKKTNIRIFMKMKEPRNEKLQFFLLHALQKRGSALYLK